MSIDDVIDAYSQSRKGNYKALRDGIAIDSEPERPLFGQQDQGPIAVLYAYLGFNARAERRLIKIGYTSQNLTTYLKTKVIAHNPQLMASRCGGRADELAEHAKWHRYLADGREWFFATDNMIESFRRDWILESDFDLIAAEALLEAPWI